MARYLLDSNVLLHLANKATGWEKIAQRLAQIDHQQILVSAVTVWEIYRQAERAKVKKSAIKASLEMLALFAVEPLTDQVAALGGSLHGWLSNRGLTIGERDSMIAATAMSGRMVMVTDNVREFARVPGITVENWRAA